MMINGVHITVFVRVKKGVTPYGGRRVEVMGVHENAAQNWVLGVHVPGRAVEARYRRDELENLDGSPLESASEIRLTRPWLRL